MEKSKITIAIPIFNNPEKLRYCLKSIENQSFKDIRIELIDDCSTVEYNSIIIKFPTLNITYIKNKKNKGAIGNIIYCLERDYDTKYYMVFHEDDLINPNYIESAINLMDKNDEYDFCVSNMFFFNSYNEINFEEKTDYDYYVANSANIVQEILTGQTISLGSVIYRSSLKKCLFDLEKYSVLGDRPFLINILQENHDKCIYIKTPIILAFNHSIEKDDNRWSALRLHHIFTLFLFYKTFYKKKDKNLKKFSTISIHNNYKLLPNQNLFQYLKLFFWGIFNNIISIKYVVLQNKKIRHLIENIKK